jgi:CheY-like chemotaxis protein
VRKDGSLFWANVIITALYDDTGTVHGFAKVTRDLTQRNRLESLEQMARRMTDCLAMLGHELRDPLASIRNAIGVMQTRTLDDPHVDWARNVIGRQTSHLARIVDDLLDVSRIASVHARGWPHSCGGPARSPLISMRDTGIGISAHLLGQIFDLLVQGERDIVQAQGGLGVGLTLATRLVEMHNGTIEASSNGPGQGSEFVIRLPTLDAAAARGKAAASAPSCAAEAAASRRVLVVDDNHDVADSTAMLLAYRGYKAIGAYDGPSVLAAAEFQPDVVLLDLDLPGRTSGFSESAPPDRPLQLGPRHRCKAVPSCVLPCSNCALAARR